MPITAMVAVSDATSAYDKLYTYLVPAQLEGHIFVGSMVLAPFGRGRSKPRIGVVAALAADDAPDPRVRELYDVAPDDAALSDELLALVKTLRETTFCTWFDAVRAVIPRGAQYKTVHTDEGWRLRRQMPRSTETAYRAVPHAGAKEEAKTGAKPKKLTAKQQAVLDFVAGGERSRAEVCAACGVGPGVAAALAARGLLEAVERDKDTDPEWSAYSASTRTGAGTRTGASAGVDTDTGAGAAKGAFVLTAAQRQIADALTARMGGGAGGKPGEEPGGPAGKAGSAPGKGPRPALLHGVTGSGKTPVFIHLVRAALAAGQTALVLVPEIGLTPQMVDTLRAAFGGQVAIQHSGLSAGERLSQWRAIRRGDTPVVVGTRSAVFAPLPNIGLIVVDEEQERSYQSETSPRYDAIEIARRRAAHHGALLLLASATPSVTSFWLAKQGVYDLFTLKERYAGVPLPEVELVDMAAEVMAGNTGALSGALRTAMGEVIEAGGQVILLLNRRGYHRVALCRGCGKAVKCGDCSVPMVLHRAGNDPEDGGFLLCHHCGKSQAPPPQTCPECGGELRYAGFGTQRLEEELAEALPGARLLRMDLDTTGRKGAHAAMLRRFAAGDYDILLGTQMVAKGLDFERVKLVGVVGIDSLLFAQGYRAFEQVFSLVTQVVGRSGRAAAGGQAARGRAMIQTVDPQNPVLRLAAAQDYEAFYEEEIGFRKLALYPPFCALCLVGFSAGDAAEALAAARRFAELLAHRAKEQPGIPLRVLGPSPMAVAQIAGSYRYRLTLKCRNDEPFRRLARQVLDDYNGEGWHKRASAWLDFHADG